jgi:glyoxylase-like metal-dependent hydrolase (beta-lactamase superfamily II)
MSIPFVTAHDILPGRMDQVSPLIRRVTAPNPGAFTFKGTGTYIVGRGEVAVIDPGPAIEAHLEALLAALKGERVAHILVTHTHLDHSPLSRALQEKLGGEILAFGPHGSGQPGFDDGTLHVEEGGDLAFAPDRRLKDREIVSGPTYTIETVATPGHTSNHLCFALAEERALFTGDHVMGWSTSVIVPPDGDMSAYMASLERLLQRDEQILWPTHGPPVRAPKAFLKAFVAHREAREAAILACLRDGVTLMREIVARIYANVDVRLHPAATLSVRAHLEKLMREGRVSSVAPFEGPYTAL